MKAVTFLALILLSFPSAAEEPKDPRPATILRPKLDTLANATLPSFDDATKLLEKEFASLKDQLNKTPHPHCSRECAIAIHAIGLARNPSSIPLLISSANIMSSFDCATSEAPRLCFYPAVNALIMIGAPARFAILDAMLENTAEDRERTFINLGTAYLAICGPEIALKIIDAQIKSEKGESRIQLLQTAREKLRRIRTVRRSVRGQYQLFSSDGYIDWQRYP